MSEEYTTTFANRLRYSGLFSRAIHQSGSSINYWAVYRNVKEQAKRFAAKFGCPTATSVDIVKCLKSQNAKTLVLAHRELMVISMITTND